VGGASWKLHITEYAGIWKLWALCVSVPYLQNTVYVKGYVKIYGIRNI